MGGADRWHARLVLSREVMLNGAPTSCGWGRGFVEMARRRRCGDPRHPSGRINEAGGFSWRRRRQCPALLATSKPHHGGRLAEYWRAQWNGRSLAAFTGHTITVAVEVVGIG
jgi:hypothetical protein